MGLSDDCRFLDPEGESSTLHPNFSSRKNKNAWERIWSYVNKEGQAIGDDIFPIHFAGYSKHKLDKNTWLADAKARNPANPFPFRFPDDEGTPCFQPKGYLREYIYIIKGKPNVGKSHWRKQALSEYFRVEDSKYPMEGYAGQQIIVYDDFPFSEWKDPTQIIIKQGEWEPMPSLVGNTRYFKVYYPAKQQRLVIIITNTFYPWMTDERIVSRTAGILEWNDRDTPPEWIEAVPVEYVNQGGL